VADHNGDDRWITDWPWSDRYPSYTRANAGEVLPEPSSPLNVTLLWDPGVNIGWAEGYTDRKALGTHLESELDPVYPETIGNFAGYHYTNLPATGIIGARMPGMTVETWNRLWIGDRDDIPPHPHRDTDENPEITAHLAERAAWVLTTTEFPEVEKAKALAHEARENRPDLNALSDAELVERARAMVPDIAYSYKWHVPATTLGAVAPSLMGAALATIDRVDALGELLRGAGNVDSAAPSFAMWDLGRVVADSSTLMDLFEGPSREILSRLQASDDPIAEDFLKSLDDLLYRYGSRAPNEWDLRSDSWETKPALVLLAINAMARSGEEMNPYTLNEQHREHRVQLTAELAEQMDEETRGQFLASAAAAVRFMPWRERGKTACIRLSNEMRVALFELGRRMVDRGVLTDHHDITLLLNSELDDFVANPEPYKETLAQRRIDYLALYDLEPPFFLTEPLPLSQWPKRGAATPRRPLATGESIQGTPGSPGVARGVARIVTDPFDLGDFGPGDVLVAPSTDPAWTPLFVPAAAVVVNVGALITHAVIISRELGLPCVVSAVDATLRIPEGALVEVDGTTGVVTVL